MFLFTGAGSSEEGERVAGTATFPFWRRPSRSVLPRGEDHDRDAYPLAEVGTAGVQCGVPGDAELAAVDSGLGPEGGRDLLAEGMHALTEKVRVEDDRLGDAVDGEVA